MITPTKITENAPPEYELLDKEYLSTLHLDDKQKLMKIIATLLETNSSNVENLNVTFSHNGLDIHIEQSQNKSWKKTKRTIFCVGKKILCNSWATSSLFATMLTRRVYKYL